MTRRLISFLVTSLFLVAAGARAQTPPANTGTTGPVDAYWEVSIDNGTIWYQAFKVIHPGFFASGFIPPNWEPNTADYSWISANSTATGMGGDYLFRTFFDLTTFDPATASLSFLCVVDNLPDVGQYSLNGGAFEGTCGHQDLYDFTGLQTLSSGFNGGINELLFHVTGDAVTDGLLVGNTSLTAVSTIPEPTSMALLATGLVGVFGAAARRRKMRGA
jgi:PEP-CTERM motif-containing protein